jgi:alkylation response protein AidB-like acyl-CoA dehydrogenase
MKEYAGVRGNFFTDDKLVSGLIKKRLPKSYDRLAAVGELAGGRYQELVEAAHQDGKYPVLRQFDRWGNRVDEIVYCPEQVEARRLALESGVLPPVGLLERMTKAYLLNQNGEGGVTCPLAMTDGLVQLLESHGTPAQQKRYGALLHDPKSATPLTGGQMATEKQGGSNLSENETRAALQADGTWRLTGLKWFCSNPGDLWVTTAKPEGSQAVGLFLVPRRRPDGSLNECHLLRLKDLSGTRGKATAEIEYRGAYAEAVGRPSHGLAILLGTVLKTSRLHVGAASLGMMRRACAEAKLYAETRVVGGRKAAEIPAIKADLIRMEASLKGATLAYFEALALLDKDDPAADILVPLLKISISQAATEATRQARLIFAGNGTLRDFSILPRLSEDALIQEIWEGTHTILAGHVLRALRRSASFNSFDAILAKGKPDSRKALKERVEALRAAPTEEPADSLEICAGAYRALAAALA